MRDCVRTAGGKRVKASCTAGVLTVILPIRRARARLSFSACLRRRVLILPRQSFKIKAV